MDGGVGGIKAISGRAEGESDERKMHKQWDRGGGRGGWWNGKRRRKKNRAF